MPSGAKKRKALKKKQQQQEAIGTSTNSKGFNGNNLHGHDEHGSKDDRESDSNLSSPGSQGIEEFKTNDPSAALSSGLVKETAKEISDVTQRLGPKSGNAIAVERGTDEKRNIVEKLPNSSSENSTQTAKNVSCQDACGDSIKAIAPVVDSVKPLVSVSKVVSFEKSEHGETSTHSILVRQKSDENKAYPSTGMEKNTGKVATLPGSAAGTSKQVESVRESEVPVSSEEKRLLLPGPPAVRTSWLSCCGLFDAMTGSDR